MCITIFSQNISNGIHIRDNKNYYLAMQTKVANDARKVVQDPLLVQHHHVAHPGLWVVQPQSILMENVHH